MSGTSLSRTPEPPYYAVIFSSLRAEGDHNYGVAARRMIELAAQQPGFLGVDSARSSEGLGTTVSYWSDLVSISNWKQNAEHLDVQKEGQSRWYSAYTVRIARVEREYSL